MYENIKDMINGIKISGISFTSVNRGKTAMLIVNHTYQDAKNYAKFTHDNRLAELEALKQISLKEYKELLKEIEKKNIDKEVESDIDIL